MPSTIGTAGCMALAALAWNARILVRDPDDATSADRAAAAVASDVTDQDAAVGEPPPAPPVPPPPRAPRTLSADEAADLLDRLRSPAIPLGPYDFGDADRRARGPDALRPEIVRATDFLGGPETSLQRQRLADAWLALVTPLIEGDPEGFAEACRRFGAPGPAGDDETGAAEQLFDRLAPMLRGGSLAADGVRARSITRSEVPAMPGLPGVPALADRPVFMSQRVNVSTRSAASGVSTGTGSSMSIVIGHVFTPPPGDADRVEITTPVRMQESRGDQADLALTLQFGWDGPASAWRPIGVTIALFSPAAEAATSGGRP